MEAIQMQICINCYRELVDSDRECAYCKSKKILSTEDYNKCKKFFMYHEKDLKTYNEYPYNVYLQYLKHKTRREKYEHDRFQPKRVIHQNNIANSSSVQQLSTADNKPKCPTCGSTNVQPIGAGEKIISSALFGLFSTKIRKSYKCNNCKYMW